MMGALSFGVFHILLILGFAKSGFPEKTCENLSLDSLCFDGVKMLNLSIMENSPASPLSTMGQFNQHCGGIYSVNYSINSKVLTIHESDEEGGALFTIWAQEGLDREKQDFHDFSVTCQVSSKNGSNPYYTKIPGRLTVLDQNDSPVESQDGEKLINVFIPLTIDTFKEGNRLTPEGNHGMLIAVDGDTLAVNKLRMSTYNDTKGLLQFELKPAKLAKPLDGSSNISSTIVYPRIVLSKNATTTHHWEGEYCVAADLIDDAQVTKHAPMRYLICMSWSDKRFTTGDAINVTSEEHATYKTFDSKLGVFESAESQCGRGCIVLYSSVSVAVMIVVIALILAVWRRQEYKKRKSAQSPAVDPSDMELSNGFGDRGGNRILLPDAEYASSGLTGPRFSGFFPNNALFNPDNFFQVESKWEIPREDLILDHVLGEGEFGRVLKGVMKTSSGTVHVAVKMLKVDETEGHKSVRQEFMAEFSLLKQLDHSNVIKLLGASTSNRGPPLLVMEYAEFGSLRSFLFKCRRIESGINLSDKSEWLGLGGGGRNIHFRNSAEICDYLVTPQEVLGFSWQIAKGMAYLSDMKMVHRDLAARNVLITKTKMCKISDFGLTRDIYVDDAYKKKSKDRVPVKWLAPECLTDELYTSKSDVWAFGVVLWELTTLGSSPYPGIQTELLYSLLDSGYRMPQPANCSNEVYSIMKRCWAKVPTDRPTFHELVFQLSRLLEDGIEYLKLDIPSVNNPGYDIFNQVDTPVSATATTGATAERPLRRNSSMENLRLIDYEISTNDDFMGKSKIGTLSQKHTYINDLNGSQDCEEETSNDNDEQINSSGYESPITLSAG